MAKGSGTAAFPPRVHPLWKILDGPTFDEMIASLKSGGGARGKLASFIVEMIKLKEPIAGVRHVDGPHVILVQIFSLGPMSDRGWRFTCTVDDAHGRPPEGLNRHDLQGEWNPDTKKGTLK